MPIRRKVNPRKARPRKAVSRAKSACKKRTVKGSTRRKRIYVPTFIERRMGNLLTRLGIAHRAQFRVVRSNGRSYYLDFAIPEKNLGIEADGKAYHSTSRQRLCDARRQAEIEQLGWTIIRFSGSDIVSRIADVEKVLIAHLRT